MARIVALLQVVQPIQMHLATLAPALLLGLVGGLLAALFARLNTFICKRRTFLLAKIPSPLVQRLVRILETVILVVSIGLCTLVRVRDVRTASGFSSLLVFLLFVCVLIFVFLLRLLSELQSRLFTMSHP